MQKYIGVVAIVALSGCGGSGSGGLGYSVLKAEFDDVADAALLLPFTADLGGPVTGNVSYEGPVYLTTNGEPDMVGQGRLNLTFNAQLEANGSFDTFLDENDQPVSGQLIAVANTSVSNTDGNFDYFLDGELTTASGDIWRYDMTGDGSLRGAGADIVGSEFGGTAERLNGAAALRGASGVFIGAPE